jgi:hypothetical protein
MSELLTTKEVASLLKCGEKGARTWLRGCKIVPVDLGRGRGKGLRWYRNEIMESLEGSRKSIKQPRKPRNLGAAHHDAMAFFGVTSDLTNRFLKH